MHIGDDDDDDDDVETTIPQKYGKINVIWQMSR